MRRRGRSIYATPRVGPATPPTLPVAITLADAIGRLMESREAGDDIAPAQQQGLLGK